MIGTYHCGKLLKPDAVKACDILARFGGKALASGETKSSVTLTAYFERELTYQERVGITSALTNEGIFAL